LKKLRPGQWSGYRANAGYFEMMLFSKMAEATVYAYERSLHCSLFQQNVASTLLWVTVFTYLIRR